MLLLAFLPSESFSTSACVAHQPSQAAPRAAVLASEADGPSPEEWREFRQKLVSGGLKLTTDVADEEAAAPSVETVRRTVAPKNEALLQSQSDELYKEYISGGWAHPSPVEAGGLMMRMPLPAQFLTQMRDGSTDFWPAKLRETIKAELPDAGEGETRTAAERCAPVPLHLCTSAPLRLCTSAPLHLCAAAPHLRVPRRPRGPTGPQLTRAARKCPRHFNTTLIQTSTLKP